MADPRRTVKVATRALMGRATLLPPATAALVAREAELVKLDEAELALLESDLEALLALEEMLEMTLLALERAEEPPVAATLLALEIREEAPLAMLDPTEEAPVAMEAAPEVASP